MRLGRLENLVSPFFLFSLFVLLLNDFVLKLQFHNVITGKLSDFSGLIVFAMFWSSFFPRLRLHIHVITAVLFIFWKSPFSQPVIEGWNSLYVISIGRTTDYSDLIALLGLPISFTFFKESPEPLDRRWAASLVGIISLFAFTATQFSEKIAYDNEYDFPGSKKNLVLRMSSLPKEEVFEWFQDSQDFEVVFDNCISRATISVSEKDGHGVITLKEIDYRCPHGVGKEKMREFFEKEFIDKLRTESEDKAPAIDDIWAMRPPGWQKH